MKKIIQKFVYSVVHPSLCIHCPKIVETLTLVGGEIRFKRRGTFSKESIMMIDVMASDIDESWRSRQVDMDYIFAMKTITDEAERLLDQNMKPVWRKDAPRSTITIYYDDGTKRRFKTGYELLPKSFLAKQIGPFMIEAMYKSIFWDEEDENETVQEA